MYKVPNFSAFEAFSKLQLLKTKLWTGRHLNWSLKKKGTKQCKPGVVEDLILKFYNCTLTYLDSGEEHLMAPWGGDKMQLTCQRQLTKYQWASQKQYNLSRNYSQLGNINPRIKTLKISKLLKMFLLCTLLWKLPEGVPHKNKAKTRKRNPWNMKIEHPALEKDKGNSWMRERVDPEQLVSRAISPGWFERLQRKDPKNKRKK